MASPDASPTVQNEEELWNELDVAAATSCSFDAHETIDDALRAWLSLTSRLRAEFSGSEDEVAYCSQRLLEGSLFRTNPDYVRIQIIYSLLQEDETAALYAISSFLLLDGRTHEDTLRSMVEESCFGRLIELINGRKQEDPDLHRLLLDLMYEMSRIERLRYEDLRHVDDNFVMYLFQLIEEFSDDVHDPYHYPIIRVLLILNEQYMIASTTATNDPDSPNAPLTNRVIKCLSLYGPLYRTFGENIILLLNRETETSLQLLILKLLYLLFTTKATYEYFYTNDLRVLLDVIIRNLLDLPNELMSLRHTYLRVMYPLLSHTQLNQPPYYKKDEIHKVMSLLAPTDNGHFDPADETTLRLVGRVSKVPWLANDDSSDGSGASEVARKLLGISLSPRHSASSTSVVDMASLQEKPGVKTPSRRALAPGSEANTAAGDEPRHHDHHHRRSSKHDSDSRHCNGDGDCARSLSRTRSLSRSSSSSSKVGSSPVAGSPLREGATLKAGSPLRESAPLSRIGSGPSKASSPTKTGGRPKKPLPEVPKHKHGTPIPCVKASNLVATPTDSTAAPNPTTKKLPPKAPPPRRKGRLKPPPTETKTKSISDLVP